MSAIASNNGKKTRGKPFQQGNKFGRGRPPGSQNKATVALQSLLEGEGEGIMRKAVELALEGDRSALRLCIERLLPPAKERTVSLELPELSTAKETGVAIGAVLRAAAEGRLTLTEAQGFASMLEVHRKTMETVEMEPRIREMEVRANEKPSEKTGSAGCQTAP